QRVEGNLAHQGIEHLLRTVQRGAVGLVLHQKLAVLVAALTPCAGDDKLFDVQLHQSLLLALAHHLLGRGRGAAQRPHNRVEDAGLAGAILARDFDYVPLGEYLDDAESLHVGSGESNYPHTYCASSSSISAFIAPSSFLSMPRCSTASSTFSQNPASM